ncbi:MAG: methyltransferase domain-containing protein [Elusimicrobia bacterium]|nr:methyltransferase domain-containing protein [Elusimicrobiota bacterium]
MTAPKILIVDDNSAVIESISHALSGFNCNVYSATSGQEGLRLALKEHPSLIISDHLLPDFSGDRLIKKLRQTNGFKKTSYILMGSKPILDDALPKDLTLRCSVLIKPFKAADLLEVVEERLGRPLSRKTIPSQPPERETERIKIAGDYQFQALHQGFFVQRIWHWNKLHLAAEKFPITGNDKLLEIGCGSGNFLAWAAAKAESVTGVDISPDAVEFARRQCAGRNNVQLMVSSVSDARFAQNAYTKIISQEVIEHLYRPEIDQLMAKAYRALEPGGLFLITTPNYRSLWPVIEWTMDHLHLAPALAGCQHVSKFNRRSLRELFAAHHFKITEEGSFNSISPWIGFLPTDILKAINQFEFNRLGRFGNLLYIIGEKPGKS